MDDMTIDEYKTFVTTGTRTGKVATVRKDGRPHVVPIWFDLDGDTLIFMTWHESVKAGNMRRDPRVSICVDEESPPYAFVMIEGTVTISEMTASTMAPTNRSLRDASSPTSSALGGSSSSARGGS